MRPVFAFDPTTITRLPQPVDEVLLVIDGAITRTNRDEAAHLDLNAIRSLPAHSLHTNTVVTDGVKHFEGVLMRDLLELVGAIGTTVQARTLNNYSVDIPMSDFYDYDVVLASHMDATQLLPSGKGPLWIVYPRDQWRQLQDIRYDYRWAWQLNRLTVK
ncbi:molybdopterin-dependent oxidoreductase [Orrella sp. 11846]|uniref:molybdopterin-dependent oxidoreductase n=1 Tax=Orrella sp. 11846 TaxID=3409913 RepID=UPI003B5A6ECF